MPIDAARPLGPVHLVADLDAFAPGAALLERVEPLLREGLPSLQLRGKGRSTEALVRAGRPLRRAAARWGCLFLVNGDARAARELDADGLHLPASGPPPAETRAALPAGLLVGASCHDEAELERARGADWVLLSPAFPTPSKPGATPLGLERLAALARRAPAPAYALGGVTAANFRDVLAAGCAGAAAIRGLAGPGGLELLRAAGLRPARPGPRRGTSEGRPRRGGPA